MPAPLSDRDSQAAVGLVGDILRRRFGWDGEDAVDPPAMTPQDWRAVIAAADRHLVLPALAASATDLDIAEALPPDVGELLGHVRAANARRNRALLEALEDTTVALNGAGIEPILLKGAARLVDGLYPGLEWRLMADLDLLVPAEAADAAWASLVERGYAVVGGDRPGSRHLAGLRHPATSAMIEVHRDLTTEHLRRIPRLEGISERTSPIAIGGGSGRLPAMEDQLVHLAVHEQLQHPRLIGGGLSLRGVLEARLLMERLGGSAVAELRSEMPTGLPRRAMTLMLSQAAALLGGSRPTQADAVDRWLLRRTLHGAAAPPERRTQLGVAVAQILALARCAEARRRLTVGLRRGDYLRRRGTQLRELILGR